jgi:WD40 repeat protein
MRTIVLLVSLLFAGFSSGQTRERGKFSLTNHASAMALDPAVKYAIIAFQDGGICCFPADQRIVPLFTYYGHKKPVTGAAFLNDAKTFVTVSSDGTFKGWDILSARKHHKEMEEKNGEAKPPIPTPTFNVTAHSGSAITALALSPDTKYAATGSTEGYVKLWDATTGKAVISLDLVHRGGVKALAFHPNGKWLATAGADKTVKFWEWDTKPKLVKTFADHEGAVNAICFSPDGKLLATGSGLAKKSGTIRMWDVETEKVSYKLEVPTDVVTSLLFDPKDKTHLVSGDASGKINAWDLTTKKVLYTDEHAEGIRGMVIASDTSRLGTFSGPTARWWTAFGK